MLLLLLSFTLINMLEGTVALFYAEQLLNKLLNKLLNNKTVSVVLALGLAFK